MTFQFMESVPKILMKKKNLEYFSFYNLFDAYETKVKRRK